MHIGKRTNKCNIALKVHEREMQKSDCILYLGDKVTSRGTQDETIRLRRLKSVRIFNQIISILKNISWGIYFFRTALILRESLFLNGISTNLESWNYISQKHLKVLEDEDCRLFANIFQSPRSTNRVLYYLETAKLPFRHILAKRRFLYLWHILT